MAYISSWRSPSNIALVKYWGKHDIQLPRNPSLSFTLSACHTDMEMQVTPEATKPELIVLYDGNPRPSFETKISSFFNRIQDQLPWLINASVVINSINTFPHGAGIASSASAMSAMALCLADIDDQINTRSDIKDESWWRRVSEFARLGSGSACRSVYPGAALWGETSGIPGSNDAYAIPWGDHLSPMYRDYQDTILVVSAEEKRVSSSAGHALMSGLAYAEVRYEEAKKNITRLIESIRTDDGINQFISICESEALQLHALMMCGERPFILIEPNTISIIKEVWRYRKESGVPVCFTLDAGPNVHLLYPSEHKVAIQDWIKNSLIQYCAKGLYILDKVGMGPEELNV